MTRFSVGGLPREELPAHDVRQTTPPSVQRFRCPLPRRVDGPSILEDYDNKNSQVQKKIKTENPVVVNSLPASSVAVMGFDKQTGELTEFVDLTE